MKEKYLSIYLCRNQEEYVFLMHFLHEKGYGWGSGRDLIFTRGRLIHENMRLGGEAVYVRRDKSIFHSSIDFADEKYATAKRIEVSTLMLTRAVPSKPSLPLV